MEHTKGPWTVERKDHGALHYVIGPNGGAVAILQAYGSAEMLAATAFTDEREANARLIAAAPDLLEALEELNQVVSRDSAIVALALERARTAINSAKGA